MLCVHLQSTPTQSEHAIRVLFQNVMMARPASWSNGNAFSSGARGLRLKSRASQIVHIGLPPLISMEEAVLPVGAMARRWVPRTRYTLRRNTVSLMKHLIYHGRFCLVPMKNKRVSILSSSLQDPTTYRQFRYRTKVSNRNVEVGDRMSEKTAKYCERSEQEVKDD